MKKSRQRIVRDAVRRFQHLPTRTIARYLADGEYGYLFEGNIEIARTAVRIVRGKHGAGDREKIIDKSLFQVGPISMPITWRKKRIPYILPAGLWLILSDLHIPFHEPMPLEAAIKWGQISKVDGILLNGDILDCAAISFWLSSHRDFNREIELGMDFLDFLRQEFPKQQIVYKPGNHEYRLPRAFIHKLPELAESPLAAMETVMGFEQRSIEFLDYFQIVMAGKLPVLHGHEIPFISRAVNPARGLFNRTKSYSACSHCHSTSIHTSKDIHGTILTTWSFGCLSDLSPDWNPYGNDWNWGCALIDVEKNGDFNVENKRILPSGELA